jgi:perosamine synthetase
MIPLSVPHICGNEWKYIKECLDTEWVSSVGKYVTRFEEDICRLTSARHSIACVNGTAALQVALQIVGVKPGDEVLVPTVTFIAPVNAIRYLNADPVFLDCDTFYNIDANKAIDFIKTETIYKNGFSYNKSSGQRISAIMTVHVFGNAVNIFELVGLCKERNIRIVEDAAESIGVFYKSGPLKDIYAGTVGDMGCYSFNGNKIITTGGGGMIVTNNNEYAEKAKYLTTQAKDHEIYYIHNEVGYNFRLTNIQAALGVAQLEKLNEYILIKKKNYKTYKDQIDNIPGLSVAEVPAYAESNYWFYCLQIDERVYGKNRDQLMEYLQVNGIQTRPIWHLNHLQKPYRTCQSYKIETAYKIFANTLNIPCSVNLGEEQISYVIEKLANGKK